MNPREHIGFAELVNSVLRCLLRSQRAIEITLGDRRFFEACCEELQFSIGKLAKIYNFVYAIVFYSTLISKFTI